MIYIFPLEVYYLAAFNQLTNPWVPHIESFIRFLEVSLRSNQAFLRCGSNGAGKIRDRIRKFVLISDFINDYVRVGNFLISQLVYFCPVSSGSCVSVDIILGLSMPTSLLLPASNNRSINWYMIRYIRGSVLFSLIGWCIFSRCLSFS